MFLSVVELQQHEEEVRRSIPLVKLYESGPELHLHNTMIACVIFFIFIVQKKREFRVHRVSSFLEKGGRNQ